MAYGFHRFTFRKIAAAAAVGAHAREKIRRDCNVACRGDLVSQILNPIRHAEDFVNDQDDGSFALGFWIDYKCLDRAAIVLDGDPLAMARRFFTCGARPVLRRSELRRAKNQQENQSGAFHGVVSPSEKSLAGRERENARAEQVAL